MLREALTRSLRVLAVVSLSLVLTISSRAGAEDATKPDAPAKEGAAPLQKSAAEQANVAATVQAASTPRPTPKLVTVKAEPFPENTTVHGEIKTDLQGVWLLLTRAEVVPGKFRNFPQIIKVTKGKDGLAFQLVEVKLPPDVNDNLQEADRKLVAWDPSSEVRAKLGKDLATLPKVTEKSVNDPPIGKVDYSLVAPDRYQEAFGALNPTLETALKGAVFGMQIVETYKPITEVTDTRISQLMQRKVLYAATSAKDDVVQGTSFVGFLASGNGQPLPLQFGGQFVMYRLAKAS